MAQGRLQDELQRSEDVVNSEKKLNSELNQRLRDLMEKGIEKLSKEDL